MTNILFTADLHLGHNNLVKRGQRPFSTCEEHDQVLMDNWNNKINKSDLIYILGDVVWNNEFSILDKFNGQKIIIKGNHDKTKHLEIAKAKGYICNWHYQKGLTIDNKFLYMQHFSCRSWERSFHGSYHIYGHSHGTLEDYKLSTDIGVDCWNFTPVNWEELKAYMEAKKVEDK